MTSVTARAGSDARAVGHRIRELRERRGWTRDELASRLEVHPGSIARWETGGSVPHAYTLGRIAALLGADAALLRAGRGEAKAPGPAAEAGGAREAGEVFASLDHVARFVEGIAPAGRERHRKLDALEGLRRMLTARGALPGWWYELRGRVDDGRL